MREIFLSLHFIGIAMAVGVSFAYLFIGLATRKDSDEDRLKVHSKIIPALGKMSHIGFGLLIITGLGMLHRYFAAMAKMPLLHAKLTLVVILFALVIYLTRLGKKVVKTQNIETLNKLQKLGKISFILGLVIIILAVYNFN